MREPSEAQKRRMEEQWGTAWGNILLIHQPTTQKKMPTYKHKPTNTIWGYNIIGGKGTYVKRGTSFQEDLSSGLNNAVSIPAEIVENGNDWEEIDYTLDKKIYSLNNIITAASKVFKLYGLGERMTKYLIEELNTELKTNV